MKGKISAIFITILMLTMVFTSCFFLTDNVKADDTISNIEISVGVINAIFHFNVTHYTNKVRINVSTASNMSNPIIGYLDPDNISSWDRDDYFGNTTYTERWYIVRGLEPNIKYYYTMYLNGTAKATGNFTTLQRFTDIWIDEMMDQYLWSASSGISLKQAYGELPTPDKPFLFNDTKNLTGNYHSVLNINGTWKAFVSHRYANGEVYQGETCDRAAGKFGFFYVYNDSGINFDNNIACCPKFYSHFWVVWDPEYNKYFAIGNNYSTDNQVDIVIDMQELGNETKFNLSHCISRTDDGPDPPWWGAEPHGIIYDTLGANKYLVALNDHGQEDSGYPGGSDRRIGLLYILSGNNNKKIIQLDDRWQDGIEGNGRTGIGLFSQLTEEPNDDEYGMTITIRNGMYIAFNRQFFEGDETPSGNETICTFLSYSRNGLNWTLFNSTQLIIPEDFDLDNTWHSVRTYGTNTPLYTEGDLDYLYIGAIGDCLHDTSTVPAEDKAGMNRLTFRKYGLTYATTNTTSGWIQTTTIPSSFCDNFTVNGNFTAAKKLNVSVINANTSTVYAGFNLSDCTTIITNSTEINVTWGSQTLSDVPAGDFKLNFSFDGGGQIYSYELEEGDRNEAPTQSLEEPTNESVGIDVTPASLNITVADADLDPIYIQFRTNASGPWVTLKQIGGVGNGEQSTTNTSLFSAKNTTYYWSANVTDTNDWSNETYHFTTLVNNAPIISDIDPANGSTGISFDPYLAVNINDTDGDYMNMTFETNASGTWQVIGSADYCGNCSVHTNTGVWSLFDNYSTLYWWSVNLTDEFGLWTNETYSFTTKGNTPPSVTTPSPSNSSTNIDLTYPQVSALISDLDGDRFNWSIEVSNGNQSSNTNAVNGTKTCSLHSLQPSTTYTWWVNVTDGSNWTRKWFTFTTRANGPPIITNENPSNGSGNISYTRTHLFVDIIDPNGDSMAYTIETEPYIGTSGGNDFNGTVTAIIGGMLPNVTYIWYVNVTDGFNTTRAVFNYSTVYTYTTALMITYGTFDMRILTIVTVSIMLLLFVAMVSIVVLIIRKKWYGGSKE